ncbi:uncharacterized protein [Procambarus clarkii]|uniref:uncharacterized protein n=1 Tax=Procambarus clarkii TaxID=6728 RepID=UPI001E674938|nr:flocculation protein FLO11-like [Procambarus clarkii]
MAELGTKLDVILEAIRRSEDYLLQKNRRINEVQEQTADQRSQVLEIEKEISQLEEQQQVCRFQLLTLETQLNSDLLLKAKLEDQAKQIEEKAELEYQNLESEEASREEKTDLLAKAAMKFNARVRLDNKDIPARREAIKLEQQQLELEKTQLLCEIKVLEDNKREEESLQQKTQQLETIVYELEKSVSTMKSDLMNQLALAHHERDRLLDPNRPSIKRLTSEIESGKEEGEYLESALKAMQKEHQELSKLLWVRENPPPSRPAGIVEPWSRPQQKPYTTISPRQHQYRFKARSSGNFRSSDAEASAELTQDVSWSAAGNSAGVSQDVSWSAAGNSAGVSQDVSWSAAGNSAGVSQDVSWSAAGNSAGVSQDVSWSAAGNSAGVSQDVSWSAAGNSAGVSQDVSWSAAGNSAGVSQDVSWSAAGNSAGVSQDVSWSAAGNSKSAESQEVDWSQMEDLDWSSLSAEGPKSVETSATKVPAPGTTRAKNVSSARSEKRVEIRPTRGEPTPSTPRTFTRNPPPPTPQPQVESRSNLPLHLLGHFMCVNIIRKDSDEESGNESPVHEEHARDTEASSASVETSTVPTEVSSVPCLKSSSATASSQSVFDLSSPAARVKEPTLSNPQESVNENSSKGLPASEMLPPDNNPEGRQGVPEQSTLSDDAFAFAPGWASMSVSHAEEDTSRPSTFQYSGSESSSERNTEGNTGKLHFKFKKTTVVHVQDYQEEQTPESSRQPYQRYDYRNQRRQGNIPRTPYSSSSHSSYGHQSRSYHHSNYRSREPNTESSRNYHQNSSDSRGNEYAKPQAQKDFATPNRYSHWKNQGGRKIRFSDKDELLGTPQNTGS